VFAWIGYSCIHVAPVESSHTLLPKYVYDYYFCFISIFLCQQRATYTNSRDDISMAWLVYVSVFFTLHYKKYDFLQQFFLLKVVIIKLLTKLSWIILSATCNKKIVAKHYISCNIGGCSIILSLSNHCKSLKLNLLVRLRIKNN
jgi:hypothetical protein